MKKLLIYFLTAVLLMASIIGTAICTHKIPGAGDLRTRLDSLFTEANKNGFHGNILISSKREIIFHKGYGFANEATGMIYSPSTLVQIGSNVKDFTKTAIYQLVEREQLRLTDPLERFVDELDGIKKSITVHDLLEHQAGLPLGMGGDDYPLTRDEMIARLKTIDLLFEPGAKREYSNIGYSLLAYIIEKISGQSYDEYVKGNILEPAGLKDTGSFLSGFDTARIAHGYSGGRDYGIILDKPHDEYGHLWNLRGNGGYLSTLDDMYRFYQALSGTGLLKNPEHRLKVFNPDGAEVLAGSDMVCFFLFANFPGVKAQAFIASNHSSYKANRLLKDVESILGIAAGNQRVSITTGNDQENSRILAPLLDRLPDNGMGKTISAYFEAYNTGDTTVMRQFFLEYALESPETPPMNIRIERYLEMFHNLGKMTFLGFRQSPEGGGWEVSVNTGPGDPATLTFFLDDDEQNRLRGIRVIAGN